MWRNTLINTPTFGLMSRELDRLFDSMSAETTRQRTRNTPLLNIWHDDAAIFIEAELPGFRIEDIDLSVTSEEVTLKGRREVVRPEGATVLRSERIASEFERTLRLGTPIDTENVEASLQNGVLTVRLPKAQAVLPRKIAVRNSLPQAPDTPEAE